MGQDAGQLAFQKTRARHGSGEMFAVIPGHGLGLAQERRGIGGPPVLASPAQGLADQVVDGGHGFAEAAVAEQHAEARAFFVKAPLQRAWAIGDHAGHGLTRS